MHSNDIKKLMKLSKKTTQTNERKGSGGGKEGDKKPEDAGNWKRKFKQAMNIPNGLNNFMSVLAEEEKINKTLISSFNSVQTPDATPDPHITFINYLTTATPVIGFLQVCFPATSVKIQSIIQNSKYDFILIDNLIRVEHLNCHLIIT